MTREVDVAIVGAGTAGLAALAEVRRAGRSFVLIDGGELGTTCARVGCMPSKALLQVASDFARRGRFERTGIVGGGQLSVDGAEVLEHVRDLRDIFVDRVLAGTVDELGEAFIAEPARFEAPGVLLAGKHRVRAARVVLATGSHPHLPPAWAGLGDRVLTTDEVFELEALPASAAVIGLGVAGLELGQALARLGVQVTGIDAATTVGGLSDAAVARAAVETLTREFPLHLGQSPRIEARDDGLRVHLDGRHFDVERAIVCVGRRPNLEGLGLDSLGVPMGDNGVPSYDPTTMQVPGHDLFLAGDVTTARPVLHEAADEGRIAGYNAARRQARAFRRRVALSIVFSDPNLCAVGADFAHAEAADAVVGEMRFGPVGRALIMGRNRGLLRLYARRRDGRLLGAELCAPDGEHLAHLLAWAVQQNLTVAAMLRMPYYHPVIEEAVQAALYAMLPSIEQQPGALAEFAEL